MFPGGYAGACLVEDGAATICWVIDRDVLAETAVTWRAHTDFLSQRSLFLAALLGDARPLWEKPVAVAAIPYGFLRQQAIADAVYPLGDQLAVIPSYTGDGTAIALHSGMMAARAVLNEHSAAEFQRAAIAQLKPQFAWAKAANLAFASGTAQRVAASLARLAPWAMPRVTAFIATMTRLTV
jgi:flavin-dependent dehydrogenase